MWEVDIIQEFELTLLNGYDGLARLECFREFSEEESRLRE